MRIPFITRDPAIPIDLINFPITDSANNRGYLREIAIQTVVGYIARSIASSKFRYLVNGERQYDDIDYMLNVRPNISQNASEFWQQFVFKLITENEVLAVFTDDGQLIIADSYSRSEYALVPDLFSSVVYRNFTYQRNFSEDDVLFLQFNNRNILTFMNQMFTDYAALYNNIYTSQLRNNQVRGILKIDSNQSQDERTRKASQELVNRIFKSFSERAVSIIPLFKGFDYSEVSKGDSNGTSPNQAMEILDGLTNELADILGVPRALLHGDVTNLNDLLKSFIKFTIDPINQAIEQELNAKIIGKEDYQKGERIQIIGIKATDALENAEAADKLVSSGNYTNNEVRVKLGDEPSDDPNLDVFYITKNYTTASDMNTTSEGGENNENN